MKKTLAIAAATIAAALILAGCSTGSGGSMPGMNHETGSATGTASATSQDHNAADVTFAQMMIPHHAQAIEMSDKMLTKGGIPAPVTALAGRIKEAQGPEIEKMSGWLQSWNEPTQMPAHTMPGHGMSGMMGDEDMKNLETAQGREAAKLFLTQMIAHHQGAVEMARTAATNGKNPDAINLGKDIVKAQEAEIKEMQDLLATL